MKKIWQNIDDAVKKQLLVDKGLNDFLKSIFPIETERQKFIQKCVRKIKTRRMLLRAQWYTEMANDQENVRQNRPALKLIFLMALAEALAKQRIGTIHIGSFDAIKEFFKYISEDDKRILSRGFKRAMLKLKHHNLRFFSILKVLYNIRNSAVHGEDYFSFSLMDPENKRMEPNLSILTSGYLGSKKRKTRVSLDVKLTYEELRDVFVRTAILNIKYII